MNNKPLNVSVEQAKLLGNALRIKIISKLLDEPRTAKQVADLLGESGGNVHYHMKKLYEGDLIELVEEKQFGGVMEKYYKSKSKWFNSFGAEPIDPVLKDDFISNDSTALSIRLNLTRDQQDQIKEEFRLFLEDWVKKTSVNETVGAQEYSIGVKINSTIPKMEEGE
ncbi:ArsR/SmtB family transcription factor [Anaerobacillus isosaccharinicus]|uniref:Transcriptional regulator n=1 Tax=Anaerobacillus isosaccharinicus TaxID=1532552 RepID=A0A1S2LJE9_9BACI|nr:helix-turn-helix domain-containing protein [Anaerobacillus isosaccharinicus]MBA5588322.1 helix-turn-helix transcriptional regulator [Anaerobacillus isosaccharinicus]QOY38242.1 helix-turn-helix transcriptional regulator [Anaerobacillus isosaccharinicus]